ncbi:proton-conducting transporter membrane subunit [Rubinisphaera sp.]|uniref:proton-conducting transporter transmembrane domain-containing protein n=1 Tax=Rubinisphaera sp. TaxID=2024857 RepID=UPI000C0F7CBF|nr:proton-conducting transporter membrane subunit [Rubinisphaera sp.]MBV11252.1 oxidoreductase [Rubinisphaera sp.]HCS52408.1 oxidoreductase [Planctomycetaceae bacterium]|tara:strand:+ start:37131 stop:38702 length:1572 start_codon:yes stop_codon:yes gene_type:complete
MIYAVLLPILLFMGIALVPVHQLNRRTLGIRRLVTSVAALHLAISLLVMVVFVFEGRIPQFLELISIGENSSFGLNLYFDGYSSLMLLLVSFVGWIICCFSSQYLDGDEYEGRYYRWTAFTIAAVSLMIVSGNLLMFFVSWVLTSSGLHMLLTHYRERPAATRAAWTKFFISRIGDAALILALVLTFQEYKTFDFPELFAAVQNNFAEGIPVSFNSLIISWLLMLGAVTKSAQFPFHVWLPQTLETPTPVSALMHAGVVNAGGYLIIRTSPMLVYSPGVLEALAVIGGFTACFAAIVMVTQTSIKKTLAYSTVAQMGFMMLQCGLGAFSLAMLHILAHSLYKAYTFLDCGGVISRRAATVEIFNDTHKKIPIGWAITFSALITLAILAINFSIFSVHITEKPGGLILGTIMLLAFTTWLTQVFQRTSWSGKLISVLFTSFLISSYTIAYCLIETMVQASSASMQGTGSWLNAILIGLCFGGLLLTYAVTQTGKLSPRLNRFYIHASNGFYMEAWYRRQFKQFS